MRFFSKFLFLARPTEQKIQLLMRQMKLTQEQVELCIQFDPSPNQSDYVTWIARWLAKKLINLPEDGERIKEQLTTFSKLKKSPGFQGNKDINAYQPGQLFTLIEENQGNFSTKQQNREKINKGSKIIIQDGDITVYKVWEPEALMELSSGTNWCTAHKNNATHYLKSGPSFIIFDASSAYAQFHPSSNQLKDRTDTEIPDGVTSLGQAGWGHTRLRTHARFISDPICQKVITQLADMNEPGVKEYMAKNTASDEDINAAFKEYGHLSDNILRKAIRDNEPLPDYELERQADRVSTKVLSRYLQKFFPNQPNLILEQKLLAEKPSLEYLSYCRKFLNRARWPEGEKALLKYCTTSNNSLMLCMEYAKGIIKGRWPEFEKRLIKSKSALSAKGLNLYAQHILNARWDTISGIQIRLNGMADPEYRMAVGDPEQAIDYAKHFINGRWPALEEVLRQLGDTAHLLSYQRAMGVKRDMELEPDTLRNATPKQLVDYASDVIGGRDPEIEKKLLGEEATGAVKASMDYAKRVIQGRWPELEVTLLAEAQKPQDPDGSEFKPRDQSKANWANYWTHRYNLPDPWNSYVTDVCKGRWPEFEQVLLKRYELFPDEWNCNQKWVQGYIQCLKEVTELVPVIDEETGEVKVYGDEDEEMAGEPVVHAQYIKNPKDWPEGHKRLASRSAGYEKVLIRNVKKSIALYEEKKDGKNWRMYNAVNSLFKYLFALNVYGGSWPEGEQKLEEFDKFRQSEGGDWSEPFSNHLLKNQRGLKRAIPPFSG